MKRLLVIAALALTACSGGKDLADGQHDLGGDVAVQVHVVKYPVTFPDKDDGISRDAPDGTEWAVVDLEYFNDSGHVASANDGTGYRVDLITSAGHLAEGYSGGDRYGLSQMPNVVPPHGSVRGTHLYAVPKGEKPKTLLLYGEVLGGGDVKDPIAVEVTWS